MGCNGGNMDEKKTLLQQIRDKEQEFASTIDEIRTRADATIATAKTEADELIGAADKAGKAAAEEFYLKEKNTTKTQIEQMKSEAGRNAGLASEIGQRNLNKAVEKIVDFVTMK